MRAIIQRVSSAQVSANNEISGSIGTGLVVLLGVENSDTIEDIEWLAQKIISLRIFNDHNANMNLSLAEVNGQIMVVSQFTLHASYKKGNRPSFLKAAKPDLAKPLYDQFCIAIEKLTEQPIQTGVFGAHMEINLINNGPVTIIIDTKNKE